MMKVYKYKDATVYIRGEVDRKRLTEATIRFMKKVERSKIQNGNKNKTRAVS